MRVDLCVVCVLCACACAFSDILKKKTAHIFLIYNSIYSLQNGGLEKIDLTCNPAGNLRSKFKQLIDEGIFLPLVIFIGLLIVLLLVIFF